mmetsp:Transcript_669/g.2717  ORF Transcript_669/g.2717 Transcript_669/m.2717 type:complete len:482 (-) Transcript_669:6317-7762(-)
MRPIACVSDASYSYCEVVRSGCTKMAWFAVVRLAPDADSSRLSKSNTRASFLGSRSSFWNSSSAPVCWCTEPFSLSVLMPASSSTAATCFIRSGNCTNTKMRSSPGVSLMRCTRCAIFEPCEPISSGSFCAVAETAPLPLAFFAGLFSDEPEPFSEPSDSASITEEKRAGHSQPGTPHSCRLASRFRHDKHPTWPHVDKTPESFLACAGATGRFLGLFAPAFSCACAHEPHCTSSSAESRCRSRTDLKKRSERTRPMSSRVSMRSARTSSRMFHFWLFSSPSSFLGTPLREGVGFAGVFAAEAIAGDAGSFFTGVPTGVPPSESSPIFASSARRNLASAPPSSSTLTCSGFIFFTSMRISDSETGTKSLDLLGLNPLSKVMISVCFCVPVMPRTTPLRQAPSIFRLRIESTGGTRVFGTCSAARSSDASSRSWTSISVPSGSPAPSPRIVLCHLMNWLSSSLSSASNSSTFIAFAVSFHSW